MKISKSFEIQERAQTPRTKTFFQTKVLAKIKQKFFPADRVEKKVFRELKHLSELVIWRLNCRRKNFK